MGVSCSCPPIVYSDLESGFESVIVKSIGLRDDEQNATDESISLKDKDSEVIVLQSLGSEELLLGRSMRFRARKSQSQLGEVLAKEKYEGQGNEIVSPLMGRIPHSGIFNLSSPKHEAAIKLQKVYKSFRTRRKLADCAVLVEQSWWKLLDFAELKHSSISFFDLDKHETAISRWSRARTRAAKVGKGLSKNSKAQKLALQHWLEAIDPRHRYGHNLDFYYVKWLNSPSREPFFYWLDIGEGKEVNLIEKCSRSKLQQQCIKYLGPMERKAYEVVVEDGKLFYKQTGEVLDTSKEPKGSKWIFVLSTSKTLYVGKKKKGSFQHSSFLAGGAALAAGRIVAENGVLKAVWPHSGHYRPTPENFQDLLSFLRDNNVDLTDVKLDSTDEEEEGSIGRKGGAYLRSNSSEDNLAGKDHAEMVEKNSDVNNSREEEAAAPTRNPNSGGLHSFSRNLAALEIPSKDNLLEKLMSENQISESSIDGFPVPPGSPMDEYEQEEESFCLQPEAVPEESVFQRINSHKEMNSYQLGKHLSLKWSTGAGPRIGCLRDYPPGLQCHALEQVNLSPRRLDFPSWTSTPAGSNLSCRHSALQYSPLKTLTGSHF